MEVILGRQYAKQNMCQYVQYLDTGRTTSFEEKFVARWGHNKRWLVDLWPGVMQGWGLPGVSISHKYTRSQNTHIAKPSPSQCKSICQASHAAVTTLGPCPPSFLVCIVRAPESRRLWLVLRIISARLSRSSRVTLSSWSSVDGTL